MNLKALEGRFSGSPLSISTLWVAAWLLLPGAFSLTAAGWKPLSGHLPPMAASSLDSSPLPSTNRLHLAIGLPLRNQIELSNLLAQIYRPGSTNYHHFISPQVFAERFGPSPGDYAALSTFARSHSLTITGTHSNRTLLDVAASTSQIEQAFHVQLRLYPHPREARKFFAPDREPTLDLPLPVLHISGLDNFLIPHPMNLRSKSWSHAPLDRPWLGSAPGGNYWGNDFRKAYVPGSVLTGTGQQVGLFQLDSGFYPSDITRYSNLAGLPTVPVTPVLINGYDGGPGNANDECSLDIEMTISMAPGLLGVLVYEGTVPNDVLNQMATDNLAEQLSSSWSFPVDPNTEQIFQQFAAQGQSFFNASGDNNAWVGTVTPPSDDPNITIVGGTTLTTDAQGAWAAEKVWQADDTNGSGGGISTQYSIPWWQQGVDMAINQGSTAFRNLPDVALTADDIYVLYGNGTNGTYGGTSCAAPLWAGFTALVNQQATNNSVSPVGFINPAIYNLGLATNYRSLFHDIIHGNNASEASPDLFFAVPGYDLCTGWGTPLGQNLIDALVGTANPTPPFIATQPQSQSVVAGANATFSVVAGGLPPLSYLWSFNGTNLVAATNAALTLNRVQTSQSGSYAVTVTNAFGFAVSSQAVLAVTQPFSCDPVPANLAGWWAAEGNANDTLGLDNGTVIGSLGYTNGLAGQAFVFDGSTSYIALSASPNLDIGATGTGITIECWIMPNALSVNGPQSPIMEWGSDTTDGLKFLCGTNLMGDVKDTYGQSHPIQTAIGLLATNSWQHVALTYDEASGTAFIYLDGTKVASQPMGIFVPQTSGPANIGRWTGQTPGLGGTYDGLMDELSIYNRALGPGEIQAIYLSGKGGKCFTPPVVTTQPINQVANVGDVVVFAVNATGSAPLLYQWLFEGNLLAGATNSTLILNNVQSAEAGNYSLLVTSPYGSALSSNAVLVINPPSGCAPVPAGIVSWWAAENDANDSLGLNSGTIYGSLGFTSGQVGQAFVFDGSPSYIAFPASPSLDIGATGTGITIECWVEPAAANVNGAGGPILEWDSAQAAGLQFWSGTNLYANLIDTSGQPHVIQTANGLLTTNSWQHVALTYDETGGNACIYLNGNLVAAQNLGSFLPQTAYPANIGRRTGQLLGLGDTYAGLMDELAIYNRALGSNEIQSIYLAGGNGKCFTAPVIVTQPASQMAAVGNNLALQVTADGTASMNYQWTFQGNDLAGATNSSLVLTNVQLQQAGNYGVLVANPFGAVTSSNAVVSVFGLPPTIATQPASQMARLGGTVTFVLTANGTTPLHYQWIFHGTNLGGAIASSLTLTNVQFNQAGNYNVQVTNAFGAVLSSNAALTVLGNPPLILVQPTNQTLLLGGSTVFAVLASGTPPLFYRWFYNGTNVLASATNATLTLVNAQTKQAGNYSVIVTNAYGQAVSSNALLSFFAPPKIVNQPASLNVKAGGTATFKIDISGAEPLSFQWYWNSTNNPIPFATNATLNLLNVQPPNAGAYFVRIANVAGSVVSSNALLVVHLQDHFAWSAIPSPRFVNVPFTVTIQAQNLANGLVTNFTGTVTLTSTQGIPMQPPVSGSFVKGSWTGSVAVAQPATNLTLQADDGLGELGQANPINIASPPALGAVRYGNIMLVYWPASLSGFAVETSPRLNSTNWALLAGPPVGFGGQYLEAFPISTTNTYYRLHYTLP